MSRMASTVPVLVTTRWLAEKLISNPVNFRLLDSSRHLTLRERNGKLEYSENHIPGAQFFDIDECCDKTSKLRHLLPSVGDFEKYVGGLGVCNNTHVVLYDNNYQMLSAPRAWWMFRVFGHNLVSVVDGGLPRWQAERRDLTTDIEQVEPRTFKVQEFQESLIKCFKEMSENIEDKSFTVIDTREAGRFNGTEPETKPDLKPGHMPGSLNIPYPSFLESDGHTFKPLEELQALFSSIGVDLNDQKPITATCGAGLSACTLALAAHLCGKQDVAVYDGSWREWYKRAKPEHVLTTG